MSEHCVHCDPLCRGNDKNPHGCGSAMWDQGECPACRERSAIVAWFLSCAGGMCGECKSLANEIERGYHLRGDDE